MFMKGKSVKHSVFPTHNGVLSHAAAFLATVGFVVYTSSERKEDDSSAFVKTIVRFIHLFSFASWVGIQFWIHVSGKRNALEITQVFTIFKWLQCVKFYLVELKIIPALCDNCIDAS
jgi:hypothetical protein